MDVADQRAQVAAALEELPVRVLAYQSLDPLTPCAMLRRGTFTPEETLGGFRRAQWVLKLMAPTGNPEAAAQMMDEWVSTGTGSSVVDALAAVSRDVLDISAVEVGDEHYETNQDGTTLYLVTEITFDVF